MPDLSVPKRWLDKHEAAAYIGVSGSTLRRLTEQGKLKPSRATEATNRSPVRYDVRQLDEYMESRAS